MSEVKASGIITLQKLIKSRGPEIAKRFYEALPPQTADVIKTLLATSWITYQFEGEILQTAAEVLFLDAPDGMYQLGQAVASEQFKGLYSIFLRIPTVPFIIERSAQVWKTLHRNGNPVVENIKKQSADLVVRDLPYLPGLQREYIGGYIAGIVKLTGVKFVQVTRDESVPNVWRWKVIFG